MYLILHPSPLYSQTIKPQTPQAQMLMHDMKTEIERFNYSYTATIHITTRTDAGHTSSQTYRLYSRNSGRQQILQTLQPNAKKGTLILYTDNAYWLYFSRVNRSTAMPASSMLSSGINYSDILSPVPSIDYYYRITAENAENNTVIMELHAKKTSMPYQKITRYYTNGFMTHAEFFNHELIKQKIIRYNNYLINSFGTQTHIAGTMRIEDLHTKTISLVRMSNIQPIAMDAHMFTLKTLHTLQNYE